MLAILDKRVNLTINEKSHRFYGDTYDNNKLAIGRVPIVLNVVDMPNSGHNYTSLLDK